LHNLVLNLFQVAHMELFDLHPLASKPSAFLWLLLDYFFSLVKPYL
jgi:hypothetical protein